MRKKDESLMDRIKEYAEQYAMDNNGRTPSTTEIGEKFDFTRVSAYRYLVAMNERGMIRYVDGEIHTDLIDKLGGIAGFAGTIDASVAAGPADMVDDAKVEEYVPLPEAFVRGRSGKFYILTVNGESMVDAGVGDDDMVIYTEKAEAEEGDIVVAYIEGQGNTLKRYLVDEKGPYLWAENEKWPDEKRFYGRRFSIVGVAFKVLKDI